MSSTTLSFFVDAEAESQLLDVGHTFTNHGDQLNFELNVDETLVESLRADELLEFFGIDSEFLIAIIDKDARP